MNASNPTKIFLLFLFVGLSIYLGLLLADKPSRVVIFDSDWVISEIVQTQSQKANKIEYVDKMSVCLAQTLEDYAKSKQVIIIPKKAAIAGGDEITAQIQAIMRKRCARDV